MEMSLLECVWLYSPHMYDSEPTFIVKKSLLFLGRALRKQRGNDCDQLHLRMKNCKVKPMQNNVVS